MNPNKHNLKERCDSSSQSNPMPETQLGERSCKECWKAGCEKCGSALIHPVYCMTCDPKAKHIEALERENKELKARVNGLGAELRSERIVLKARAEKAEDALKFERQMRAVGEKELCKLAHEDVSNWVGKLQEAEAKLATIEKDLRERIAKYESGRGKGGVYSILLKELDEFLGKHFPDKTKKEAKT